MDNVFELEVQSMKKFEILNKSVIRNTFGPNNVREGIFNMYQKLYYQQI